MHLANRYKRFAKSIFLISALLAWLIVASGSIRVVCHEVGRCSFNRVDPKP